MKVVKTVLSKNQPARDFVLSGSYSKSTGLRIVHDAAAIESIRYAKSVEFTMSSYKFKESHV